VPQPAPDSDTPAALAAAEQQFYQFLDALLNVLRPYHAAFDAVMDFCRAHSPVPPPLQFNLSP
jgi:hypothetical protein